MSADKIWISRAMMDSTIIKAFRPDEAIWSSKKIIDTKKRNTVGEPLSTEFFPTALHGEYRDHIFRKKLPDICTAGPYWIVSEPVADVLIGLPFPCTSTVACVVQ